ncbi:TPA: hypothetical protein I7738_22260, partial [Vibrio vulnificus]|nr:hypothetical protein [Vibrio vulnificus]
FMVDTSTNETAVTLYFASNNRKWTQSIRIVKTDQGRQELSYVSDSDGTLLKSYVAPNFPKHNGKYIIWSNKTKEVGDI